MVIPLVSLRSLLSQPAVKFTYTKYTSKSLPQYQIQLESIMKPKQFKYTTFHCESKLEKKNQHIRIQLLLKFQYYNTNNSIHAHQNGG